MEALPEEECFGYIDGYKEKGSENPFESYEICKRVLRLGREHTSDLRLHNMKISRHQCELHMEGTGDDVTMKLVNLTGKKTTIVRGEVVAPHGEVVVRPGDRFSFYEQEMRFRPLGEEAPKSPLGVKLPVIRISARSPRAPSPSLKRKSMAEAGSAKKKTNDLRVRVLRKSVRNKDMPVVIPHVVGNEDQATEESEPGNDVDEDGNIAQCLGKSPTLSPEDIADVTPDLIELSPCPVLKEQDAESSTCDLIMLDDIEEEMRLLHEGTDEAVATPADAGASAASPLPESSTEQNINGTSDDVEMTPAEELPANTEEGQPDILEETIGTQNLFPEDEPPATAELAQQVLADVVISSQVAPEEDSDTANQSRSLMDVTAGEINADQVTDAADKSADANVSSSQEREVGVLQDENDAGVDGGSTDLPIGIERQEDDKAGNEDTSITDGISATQEMLNGIDNVEVEDVEPSAIDNGSSTTELGKLQSDVRVETVSFQDPEASVVNSSSVEDPLPTISFIHELRHKTSQEQLKESSLLHTADPQLGEKQDSRVLEVLESSRSSDLPAVSGEDLEEEESYYDASDEFDLGITHDGIEVESHTHAVDVPVEDEVQKSRTDDNENDVSDIEEDLNHFSDEEMEAEAIGENENRETSVGGATNSKEPQNLSDSLGSESKENHVPEEEEPGASQKKLTQHDNTPKAALSTKEAILASPLKSPLHVQSCSVVLNRVTIQVVTEDDDEESAGEADIVDVPEAQKKTVERPKTDLIRKDLQSKRFLNQSLPSKLLGEKASASLNKDREVDSPLSVAAMSPNDMSTPLVKTRLPRDSNRARLFATPKLASTPSSSVLAKESCENGGDLETKKESVVKSCSVVLEKHAIVEVESDVEEVEAEVMPSKVHNTREEKDDLERSEEETHLMDVEAEENMHPVEESAVSSTRRIGFEAQDPSERWTRTPVVATPSERNAPRNLRSGNISIMFDNTSQNQASPKSARRTLSKHTHKKPATSSPNQNESSSSDSASEDPEDANGKKSPLALNSSKRLGRSLRSQDIQIVDTNDDVPERSARKSRGRIALNRSSRRGIEDATADNVDGIESVEEVQMVETSDEEIVTADQQKSTDDVGNQGMDVDEGEQSDASTVVVPGRSSQSPGNSGNKLDQSKSTRRKSEGIDGSSSDSDSGFRSKPRRSMRNDDVQIVAVSETANTSNRQTKKCSIGNAGSAKQETLDSGSSDSSSSDAISGSAVDEQRKPKRSQGAEYPTGSAARKNEAFVIEFGGPKSRAVRQREATFAKMVQKPHSSTSGGIAATAVNSPVTSRQLTSASFSSINPSKNEQQSQQRGEAENERPTTEAARLSLSLQEANDLAQRNEFRPLVMVQRLPSETDVVSRDHTREVIPSAAVASNATESSSDTSENESKAASESKSEIISAPSKSKQGPIASSQTKGGRKQKTTDTSAESNTESDMQNEVSKAETEPASRTTRGTKASRTAQKTKPAIIADVSDEEEAAEPALPRKTRTQKVGKNTTLDPAVLQKEPKPSRVARKNVTQCETNEAISEVDSEAERPAAKSKTLTNKKEKPQRSTRARGGRNPINTTEAGSEAGARSDSPSSTSDDLPSSSRAGPSKPARGGKAKELKANNIVADVITLSDDDEEQRQPTPRKTRQRGVKNKTLDPATLPKEFKSPPPRTARKNLTLQTSTPASLFVDEPAKSQKKAKKASEQAEIPTRQTRGGRSRTVVETSRAESESSGKDFDEPNDGEMRGGSRKRTAAETTKMKSSKVQVPQNTETSKTAHSSSDASEPEAKKTRGGKRQKNATVGDIILEDEVPKMSKAKGTRSTKSRNNTIAVPPSALNEEVPTEAEQVSTRSTRRNKVVEQSGSKGVTQKEDSPEADKVASAKGKATRATKNPGSSTASKAPASEDDNDDIEIIDIIESTPKSRVATNKKSKPAKQPAKKTTRNRKQDEDEGSSDEPPDKAPPKKKTKRPDSDDESSAASAVPTRVLRRRK